MPKILKKLGKTKNYTPRTTPDDARNTRIGGWIDTGDSEGRNENHSKWAIFSPQGPWREAKKTAKKKNWAKPKNKPLELPTMMLETSKKLDIDTTDSVGRNDYGTDGRSDGQMLMMTIPLPEFLRETDHISYPKSSGK